MNMVKYQLDLNLQFHKYCEDFNEQHLQDLPEQKLPSLNST